MLIQFSACRTKVLPSKKSSPIVFPEVLVLCFQIGSRSSVYSPESSVRKTGSYIYEEFMPTDGTDVKVRQSLERRLPAGLGWLRAGGPTELPLKYQCEPRGAAVQLGSQAGMGAEAACSFPRVLSRSVSWKVRSVWLGTSAVTTSPPRCTPLGPTTPMQRLANPPRWMGRWNGTAKGRRSVILSCLLPWRSWSLGKSALPSRSVCPGLRAGSA